MKGKVIYSPSGKAGEYAKYAANFYVGCSAKCEYCYNRKGRSKNILGGDSATLKKSLVNENKAFEIFVKEVLMNKEELQEHGLFLNFVSDPCLKETIDLNFDAIYFCYHNKINVFLLTKQVWWMGEEFFCDLSLLPENVAYGFTLTNHDELEPGAAPNCKRIIAMHNLHTCGFKTWASIEPVVDFECSIEAIRDTYLYCDLYKIGLESGKKFKKWDVYNFVWDIIFEFQEAKIYFKDFLLQAAGITRDQLPSNICVSKDYNLFKS